MTAYRARVLGLAAVVASTVLLSSGSAWAFTCSITGDQFNNEGATDGGSYLNTACGNTANATGGVATAFGQGSQATGLNASAFGEFARATADYTSAFGQNSLASAAHATAVGWGAVAGGTNSTAVGDQANVNGHANAAVFGAGAQATADNQQVFGTASNTYTMRGIASAASTAAQSGRVGIVTSDSGGNLAVDTDAFSQIGKNQQGVAMALALSDFWVPTGKKFAAGMNVGTWDGSWAVGGNIGGEIGDGAYLTGGIAVSQTGMVAGRAGGVVAW